MYIFPDYLVESLLRVNEAELKYPLWAKRCAPGATGLWPKGAILVRCVWFALRNETPFIGINRAVF
jgi:hypothetical protein